MSPRPRRLLPAGTPAVDFSLPDGPDSRVSLSDYVDSPIVLLFYVADFHPVCTRQITVFNEVLPEFHRLGAQVLGISHDNIWSHIGFARHTNLHFPLLADFYPRGEVSRAYRVPSMAGVSARAVFVINKDRRIVWSELALPDVALDAKGAFEAIERLQENE